MGKKIKMETIIIELKRGFINWESNVENLKVIIVDYDNLETKPTIEMQEGNYPAELFEEFNKNDN